MKRQEILKEHFVPREEMTYEQETVKQQENTTQGGQTESSLSQNNLTKVTIRIDKSEAYRVYDRFDESELTVLPDGDFIAQVAYPLDDWVYGFVLSFGPSARVLAPEHVRLEMKKRVEAMCEIYK